MVMTKANLKIGVQAQDFDLSAECAALRKSCGGGAGALVSFVGVVRDEGDITGNEADNMTGGYALELEHYPGMTEKALTAMAHKAAERFDLLAATVIHRIGKLCPGEQIVLVITASAHRRAAFEGCEYIMDYLKTQAPLWKKETAGDKGHWVDARESDGVALSRWHGEQAGECLKKNG